MAGLDGAPGLPALALPGLSFQLESQLQPNLHHHSGFFVAQMGFAQFVTHLWDSRRPFPIPGSSGAGIFARPDLNLWDSIPAPEKTRPRPCKNPGKVLTSNSRFHFGFRGNGRILPRSQPLMG